MASRIGPEGTVENIGVSTQLIAGGDIFPALELGTIDATEFSMPAVDLNLGLLGVKKETIIEDYLLTNKYFKGPIINEDWRDTSSEKLKPLFEARVDYINAAFSEIYLSYNSIEDFVVKELEINNQTVDLLKTRILE